MKYVFGPVPSRRLGRSLGIDTVPLKTCNWNCVYCQLGRSQPIVTDRREYLPREDILAEVRQTLAASDPETIDWVTFVASGETTLHRGLGWLVREVRSITDRPVAVITNGSLLYQPDVRDELIPADAVIPTLDAGSAEVYRRINRPHPDLTFERHVQGLIDFRRVYSGAFWLEVMLVGGMNDTVEALEDLRQILIRMRPDEIHLLLPDRPPAETWVHAPDDEGIMRATTILGDIARVVLPTEGTFQAAVEDSLAEAVLGIVTRHPMTDEQLERTLARWAAPEIARALKELEAEGSIRTVQRAGTRFRVAAQAHFPDERRSARTRHVRGRCTGS